MWNGVVCARGGYKGQGQVDGLMQERRNSSALAMELRLSCTDPSKYLISLSICHK